MLMNSRVQLRQLPKWYRSVSTSAAKLPDLNLKSKIETIPRKGSFMRDFYFERVDPKILAFPRLIIEEDELNAMKTVPDILRQNVDALQEIGDRSCTEIAIIYEATGRLGVPDILDRIQHTMSHYLLNQVGRSFPETAKIGYGHTEREDKMGALPISEWESMATFNADTSSWHIKGTKSMLLDEEYEKYIVFCKNEQVTVDGWPADRPPPTAYAAFLLDKSNVHVSRFTLGNISFQKITFDTTVGEDCVLFHPSIERGELFKSKALGHLAVASWTLGRLKEYHRYMKERKDLNWVFSFHLFAFDSLVYYVAGLMDSFAETDFELEGLSLKVNAMEMAERCTNFLSMCHSDCRQSNFGLIGPLNDSFALADLFYESSDRAKILIGLEALSYVASYESDYIHKRLLAPIYPEVAIPRIRKWWNRKLRRNATRLAGYFDISNSHTCNIIESAIEHLAYLTEGQLLLYSKDVLLEQMNITRLGHAGALTLKMLASHTRSDHANTQKLSGFDHMIVANHYCVRYDGKVMEGLLDKANDKRMNSGDAAIDKVFSRSLKYGGYWAYSPLDKVIH